MKIITLICILFLITLVASKKELGRNQNTEKTPTRDVCILGAGASGLSAATFLKDKGYDVLVLERRGAIGGHCKTSYFDLPVGVPAGSPNWIELGVTIFPDTKYQNYTTGTWTFGSRQFAERFTQTIDYNITVPNFGYDFGNNVYLGPLPSNPPTPEYLQAFTNFNTILATQYPWLENVQFPDPIPAELLLPFGNFITTHNLQPIESFFYSLLFFGGMGDYHNVPTLYALQNLRIGISSMYFNPASGFNIKNGCSSIYNGIRDYIGSGNIILNADVIQVKRNPEKAHVDYLITGSNKVNKVKCNKLIVAFPQVLANLAFLDLNEEETGIFQDVRTNSYYGFEVDIDVQGALATSPGFNLANINITSPTTLPSFPSVLVVRRELPYGPASGYAYAETAVPTSEMYSLVNGQLGNLEVLPNTPLTKADLTEFFRHGYQAHFTDAALAQSPTPYTKLKILQGKRNTFWTGALFSFAETASIWQKTYTLIEENFPSKK